MLKMVDGTGIIGVDMICPLGISTPQPPNYDKVELEGAGMLALPNSLDAPLERLELGGKTEQVQTTGVNLFDEKLLLDFDSENYDKTQSGSGFYYYKFPVSGTVTVSTKNANKNGEYLTVGIKPDGSDKTWLSHGSAAISKYKTLTPEDGNIYLGVNNNLERVKSMIQNTGGIMLNEGSAAQPYEPYTGNKPSPSPEYPQEIKNVGKWNEEKQKYEVDVKVFAGNLFDGSNSKKGFFTGEFGGQISLITSQGYSWESKIDTLSGVKVTLSVQSNVNTRFRIYATDINGMILYKYEDSSANQADNYHTFVIPDKTENLLVSVLEISDSKDAKIILNVGENRLPNAIYKAPQSLTLTSDRPLTKWDRLVEQGGEIGWLYTGVVIDRFDGQSNKISIANKQGNVQNFSIRFENVANGNGNSDIFVDKYRAVQLSYTKAEYGICCNWNDGVKYFSAPNENVATVDEFKAWLIENPLKIAYETTNPEFIPLPQSEQNAIRALKTYYPTTVIRVDGGELDPDIKVTYRKEI
jgi:hypothetical protein